MSLTKRDDTIDILRGLAIILVVLGHAGVNSYFGNVIYFFHMPLFFFISGCFFKPLKKWSMISYIKNLKWKGVYSPFVIYSLIFLMLSPILYYCGLSNTHLSTTAEWLKSIGLVLRFRTATVDLLGQFWFLPILFWSHALTLVVAKCKHKGWVCLVAFIIYTIGRLLYNEGYKEPYDFSRIMYFSAFYMMGYATYRHLATLFLNKYIVIISASLFIGLTFIPNLVFADVILYAIVAFLGILITYALSNQLALRGGGGVNIF